MAQVGLRGGDGGNAMHESTRDARRGEGQRHPDELRGTTTPEQLTANRNPVTVDPKELKLQVRVGAGLHGLGGVRASRGMAEFVAALVRGMAEFVAALVRGRPVTARRRGGQG